MRKPEDDSEFPDEDYERLRNLASGDPMAEAVIKAAKVATVKEAKDSGRAEK